MRVTLSICALFLGLVGTYLVGAGFFLHEPVGLSGWDLLLRPFSYASALSCFVLASSVAMAFFGLAVVSTAAQRGQAVRAADVLIWGGLFNVMTAAGLTILLYLLWRQGSTSRDLGLVLSLATVQGVLGALLGGGATIVEKNLRHVTVPILVVGLLETALTGAVVAYGYAV